jgi:hypothetical protein
LTVVNGTFAAWLNTLALGRSDAEGGASRGVLDLRGATSAMLDIEGDAYLGHWFGGDPGSTIGGYSIGELRMNGGSVRIGGNLMLADDSDVESDADGPGRGTLGKLYLTNTTVAVEGRVMFYGQEHTTESWKSKTAQVFATVAGQCSGLDVTSAGDYAFVFHHGPQPNARNLIEITFKGDPQEGDDNRWYWGLRYKGNHTNWLAGTLVGDGRLVVQNDGGDPMSAEYWNQVDIVYDTATDYSYVGFQLAPPGAVFILR